MWRGRRWGGGGGGERFTWERLKKNKKNLTAVSEFCVDRMLGRRDCSHSTLSVHAVGACEVNAVKRLGVTDVLSGGNILARAERERAFAGVQNSYTARQWTRATGKFRTCAYGR